MVSVAQLRDAGLSAAGIRWRATGRAAPSRHPRGVLRRRRPAHRPPLAAEAAALLAVGPGAVLVAPRAAAAMWGLRQARPGRRVDVIAKTRKRNRPGMRVHQAADLRTRTTSGRESDSPLTSPYRSILDLAPEMSARELDVARCQRDSASDSISRRRRRKTLIDAADDHSQRSRAAARRTSSGERDSPTPKMNVRVAGVRGRLLLAWHTNARRRDRRLQVPRPPARVRARPQEGTRARRGRASTCVRISWRQLVDEPELVGRLAGATALSAVPRDDGRVDEHPEQPVEPRRRTRARRGSSPCTYTRRRDVCA